MTSESLKPEESIKIINQMISNAKERYQSMNIFFILWGIIISISGIISYLLTYETSFEHPYIAWIILPCIGGILSGIIGKRQSSDLTPTMIDRVIFITWTGFVIALIISVILNVYQKQSPSADIMLLTGLATAISGYTIRFTPLIIGGISFWIMAILTILFFEEYAQLMTSISVIIGYLIPGLMLKKKETKRA